MYLPKLVEKEPTTAQTFAGQISGKYLFPVHILFDYTLDIINQLCNLKYLLVISEMCTLSVVLTSLKHMQAHTIDPEYK